MVDVAADLKPFARVSGDYGCSRAYLEKRQGFKIASPEEIAFRMGFINAAELESTIKKLGQSNYGRYLQGILNA